MSKDRRRIKAQLLEIFQRYTRGEVSKKEEKFVDKFYDHIGRKEVPLSELQTVRDEIKASIDQNISRQGRLRKIPKKSYVNAAATLLVASIASLLIWYMQHDKDDNFGEAVNVALSTEAPVLTIGNDKNYELTDTLSYTVIDDQQVFVVADFEKNIADNSPRRISNPTKQVFSFLLNDGSQVWINANSYVEFSSGFGLTERIVSTYGEVSFDVKKKSADGRLVPFIVKTPLQTIEVLGTQFSVNTYEEKEESIMLLEGSVKLTHNDYNSSVVLSPGQKAHVNSVNARILVASSTDGYKVKAWRRGLFHFEEERIAQVIDEFSQWYEVRFMVDPTVRDIPITGIISRYEKVEDVLQMIEMTADVKFEKIGGVIYAKNGR